MNTKERIDHSQKRIEELKLLIQHWQKDEEQKQVSKA
jgi:hypothetical protein